MITIKDVRKSVTLEYLRDLEKWVDVDIANIGKDSYIIKQMKAKSRGISIEELDKNQLEELTDLKKEIQNRITELTNRKTNVEEHKIVDIDKIIETSTDVKYLNNLINIINADIKMMGEFPEFLEIKDKILKRMSQVI